MQDVIEYLRTLPAMERREIGVDGRFPVSVQSTLDVTDVIVTGVYEKNNPARTLGSDIAWHRSEDPRDPGVVIDAMSGITVDTEYVVSLLLMQVR